MSNYHQELIQHLPRLKNFAYKLTSSKEQAEDLAHDTIVKAIDKKHLFQTGTNLYSWLAKIQYNLFVSKYRRKKKFESDCDIEDIMHLRSVEAKQETNIKMQEIDQIIKSLPEDFQEILLLVCIKDYSYENVAEMLNIPVGTVRSRLFRARKEMKERLDASHKIKSFKPIKPKPSTYSGHTLNHAA